MKMEDSTPARSERHSEVRRSYSTTANPIPAPATQKNLSSLVILAVCFVVVGIFYIACAPGARTEKTVAGSQSEPYFKGKSLSTWTAELKNPATQQDATMALAQMGPKARLAVPALLEALKSPDKNVRSSAAFVLGRIGTEAKSAVPDLIDALKDSNQDVRLAAAIALQWIGSEVKRTAVNALVGVLKEQDADLRGRAASALADSGPEARYALPALKKALKDPDERVRQAAASALKRIEPESPAKVGSF